jgi:hypothetical protein
MKKYAMIMMAVAGFAGAQAHADGFNCQTVEGDLNVKVYNQTDANQGTRNVAVMVLSDPSVQGGRKTIARFTEANGVVASRSATFTADVDLRFTDSSRKGELISGTKLGQLDQIIVDVDFSYAAPVEQGEELSGELTLIKRDGQKITRDLECSRYLKN